MTNETTVQERNEARSIDTPESALAKTRSHVSLSFPVAMTALYAVLLGIVDLRHEIGYEEGQAWLIARGSTSVANLFHNIRYEGHPSLWYLLLYLPAHISWNPISMQAINYVLAIGEAGLILTESRLSRSIRALLVFSYFVFFGYGVLARNYMLTILLLTAAARCLLRRRSYPWLAILLLALACNAHFFAIPLAAMLFVFLYCFPEPGSWRRWATLLRQKQFWTATAISAASLIATYFTIRPPADSFTPHYGTEPISIGSRFLISLGSFWQAFFPFRTAYLPNRLVDLLAPTTHPSLLAITLSLVVLFLFMAAMRSARARWFFFSCAVFEILLFAVTVHNPRMHHLGLIFCALIFALMIDAHSCTSQSGKPSLSLWLGKKILYVSLTLSMLAGAWSFAADLRRPFSEGKETAQWLKESSYSAYPLVAQLDYVSTSLLAYLPNDKAYHPECSCFESFVLYNTGRTDRRVVTSEQLDSISNLAHTPVVVALTFQPNAETLDKLGLHLIKAFDRHPMDSGQRFFVYLRQPISEPKRAGQ